MSAYEEAVATLYRAPLSDFVAERKRLAAELKAAGDKDASARVAKLVRPPVSAWAVNQLWWREREAFEGLIAAAARVKRGERDASQAHRQALARLKDTAALLLREASNAATETTLRRVTTTLSAVAAIGSFEPDVAGALSADRDPPGFESLGFAAVTSKPVTPPPVGAQSQLGDAAPLAGEAERRREEEAERRREEEAERRREEEAERRRAEEAERRRRSAERERLSALLREAEQLRTSRQNSVQRLRGELDAAEQDLQKSQAQVQQIEAELASL